MKMKHLFITIIFICFSLPRAFCPGLANLGDDCFLNVAMQVLYSLDDLNDYLSSLKSNFDIQKNCLLDKYLNEIAAMKEIDNENATIKDNAPKKMYSLESFRDFLSSQSNPDLQKMAIGQQDAQEVIILFLTLLTESDFTKILINKNSNLPVTKKISDEIKERIRTFFQGHYYYEDKCDKGHIQPKAKDEPFGDLRLNIFFPEETINPDKKFSVPQLLDQYFFQENEQELNYYCEKCGQNKTTRFRTVKIRDAGKYLILILRRYWAYFDKKTSTVIKTKINNQISFDFNLNIGLYTKRQNDIIYTLQSILIHSGTPEGGHYFGYYKNKEDAWYYANDSTYDTQNLSQIREILKDKRPASSETTPYVLIYTIDPLKQKSQSLETLLQMHKTELDTIDKRIKASKTELDIINKRLRNIKSEQEVLKKRLDLLKSKLPEGT